MGDSHQLEQQAADLERRRKELLTRQERLASEILDARADEYRDVVIAGRSFAPSDAARFVCEARAECDYIPGPVERGACLPLADEELAALYATNAAVSVADEDELKGELPALESLPSPDEFDRLLAEKKELTSRDLTYRGDMWRESASEDVKSLDELSERTGIVVDQITSASSWQLAPMLAGYRGTQQRQPWESLLDLIDNACQTLWSAQDALIQHQPQLPDDLTLEASLRTAKEILAHLENGGSLSALALITRPTWRSFIRGSHVATGEARRPEHFQALFCLADLSIVRQQVIARWDAQLVPLGLPRAETFEHPPETACQQFSTGIRRSLDWSAQNWLPLRSAIVANGLCVEELFAQEPPDLAGGELGRLASFLSGTLQRVLAARRDALRCASIDLRIHEAISALRPSVTDRESTGVVRDLREAIESADTVAYRRAVSRLVELHERCKHLARRRELMAALAPAAPGWVAAIEERRGIHGKAACPPRLQDAWLWRQLNDELDRRGRVSIRELQRRSESISRQIREATADLIERRAWAAQVQRTERNLSRKQALIGWLDTIKKIGRGTGVRVPRLRAEANRLMAECREAVPVWVMPLSRVVENFNPASAAFDVVIIDEASQCDVMGLLALFLGARAIVVGDHEQVSPSAVGQELGIVQHLIDEHLHGIRNGHLYDGRTSIYDLARQSFGGTIRLVEHFRCVPEIIQFSNQLSYEGAIRPLRDATKVPLKPHVIAHRVAGGSSKLKSNELEAEEVAALVAACCEQPEYSNKDFGVVSLVGDDQAYLIESLLRKHLSEEEFKLKHNILCGNPAHFQGDERDVMFLSVVDTSDGGVLPRREEPMFKQRFNVAASRAKDQMWVVHSLDPRSQLQPGDLRRRLIEYAEDPSRVLNAINSLEQSTESPFETEVAARLVRAGFRVIPQWRVGYYRIDLVVEGAGKRLAIECDGDRFHPLEKLQEDMARQAVLERLGWNFVRIRGSRFYRDPENTMASVISSLDAAGIGRIGSENAPEDPSSEGKELIERVLRRANEIKRTWRASNGDAERGDREKPGAPELTRTGCPTPPSLPAELPALSVEAARAKLIELREKRIAKDHPKRDPRVPLLRDQIITALVIERPKNEREWSQKMPVWMTREADLWHVQKYLPEIFEIISNLETKN
jgi:very-short-patch-repair endonuclease